MATDDLRCVRFNRLVVLTCEGVNKRNRREWACLCDCGGVVIALEADLKSGNTKSCGCLSRDIREARCTVHGHNRVGSRTKEHRAWANMLDRCENTKNSHYKDYGGRGIAVCKRWHKFKNFLTDMGLCPDKCTLDRAHNDKGYNKTNCRWADVTTQANNKRSTLTVNYASEAKSLKAWSRDPRCSVKYNTLHSRYKKGLRGYELLQFNF